LKLQYDEPLSNIAFNFNLRRYILVGYKQRVSDRRVYPKHADPAAHARDAGAARSERAARGVRQGAASAAAEEQAAAAAREFPAAAAAAPCPRNPATGAPASPSIMKRGSSQYVGVSLVQRGPNKNKWMARSGMKFCGYHLTEDAAARAYNVEAERVGRPLNIIPPARAAGAGLKRAAPEAPAIQMNKTMKRTAISAGAAGGGGVTTAQLAAVVNDERPSGRQRLQPPYQPAAASDDNNEQAGSSHSSAQLPVPNSHLGDSRVQPARERVTLKPLAVIPSSRLGS
jgi:hypothetical protein